MTEQASLENAEWVLEGTLKGLFEIFPSRFLEDGAEQEVCEDVDGAKTWGAANCEQVIIDYKAAKGIPTALYNAVDAVVPANITCFE